MWRIPASKKRPEKRGYSPVKNRRLELIQTEPVSVSVSEFEASAQSAREYARADIDKEGQEE